MLGLGIGIESDSWDIAGSFQKSAGGGCESRISGDSRGDESTDVDSS